MLDEYRYYNQLSAQISSIANILVILKDIYGGRDIVKFHKTAYEFSIIISRLAAMSITSETFSEEFLKKLFKNDIEDKPYLKSLAYDYNNLTLEQFIEDLGAFLKKLGNLLTTLENNLPEIKIEQTQGANNQKTEAQKIKVAKKLNLYYKNIARMETLNQNIYTSLKLVENYKALPKLNDNLGNSQSLKKTTSILEGLLKLKGLIGQIKALSSRDIEGNVDGVSHKKIKCLLKKKQGHHLNNVLDLLITKEKGEKAIKKNKNNLNRIKIDRNITQLTGSVIGQFISKENLGKLTIGQLHHLTYNPLPIIGGIIKEPCLANWNTVQQAFILKQGRNIKGNPPHPPRINVKLTNSRCYRTFCWLKSYIKDDLPDIPLNPDYYGGFIENVKALYKKYESDFTDTSETGSNKIFDVIKKTKDDFETVIMGLIGGESANIKDVKVKINIAIETLEKKKGINKHLNDIITINKVIGFSIMSILLKKDLTGTLHLSLALKQYATQRIYEAKGVLYKPLKTSMNQTIYFKLNNEMNKDSNEMYKDRIFALFVILEDIPEGGTSNICGLISAIEIKPPHALYDELKEFLITM